MHRLMIRSLVSAKGPAWVTHPKATQSKPRRLARGLANRRRPSRVAPAMLEGPRPMAPTPPIASRGAGHAGRMRPARPMARRPSALSRAFGTRRPPGRRLSAPGKAHRVPQGSARSQAKTLPPERFRGAGSIPGLRPFAGETLPRSVSGAPAHPTWRPWLQTPRITGAPSICATRTRSANSPSAITPRSSSPVARAGAAVTVAMARGRSSQSSAN